MSRPDAPPFSRTIEVASVPPGGLDLAIAADEAARERIARDFGIPAVPALNARYHLAPTPGGGVRVTGEIEGRVVQVCVVTLEPFEAPVREEVEAAFAPAGMFEPPSPGDEIEITDLDAPDPIVDGRVDLGAITAEFLALALDPYPRKPDADFDFAAPEAEDASPFAALKALARPERDER